jgi:hypothetical protein
MEVVTIERRVYTAVKGSHLSDEDAGIVGPELEVLAAAKGGDTKALTPAEIVEAARAEASPLHRFFEWDDSEAARQHRLWQARHLANSWRVEIRYVDRGERTTFVAPGLVNVRLQQPTADGGAVERAYIPVEDALSNPAYRAQLLADARGRLEHWRARFEMYRTLPEFAPLAPVFEAIEHVADTEAEGEVGTART